MKRIILVIAIILSLIVFPFIANANDSTEVNIANPILQKQEVKLPWYKELSYGIDYSGGIYYTGKDLAPYTSDFQIILPLYWMNSIEISATYHLKDERGVEVGLGYGWASIKKYSDIYYKFRLVPIWIGYSQNNLILRGAFVYSCSPGYYYRGKGYKISAVFRINRVLGIGLNFGRVWYSGKTTGERIYLLLNGISFSIGYNFKLKGSAR